jgi:hypothetical protein
MDASKAFALEHLEAGTQRFVTVPLARPAASAFSLAKPSASITIHVAVFPI